jgi:glycosyltransferase involved in cell wall biosynthesis
MKIVIQSDSRIWGGNEKWLLLVGVGLKQRGHDVLVSCRPGSPVAERARAANLRITHARPGADADLVRVSGFWRMLRRERPDAVLLSAFKRSFWGGWAARRAGVPRVVERLGIERDLPAKWKYRHAFRYYIDGLIVNSGAIRDRWLRSAPWYPSHEVHVVLNGVQPPDVRMSPARLRQSLGIPVDAPVLAGAGRLEHRKGFDVLLRAFALCDERQSHLLIAGDGADRESLTALAAQLGVSDRVHWVGFRADLPAVLSACDVFVLSSRVEGMANVMLEAMAAGCLIVATDISGVKEAIGSHDGRPECGWIVPVDDAAAMAMAMDAAMRVRRADAVRSTALEHELAYRVKHWFSQESTVDETERILEVRT